MRFPRRALLPLVLVSCVAALAFVVVQEIRTSRWQARMISGVAREVRFEVGSKASDAIRFPGPGPFDEQRGYRQLPGFIERLAARDYEISAQARISPMMATLADRGLFAAYRESSQAGLDLRDCRADPLYGARYPRRVYERFDAVPHLIVDALLFIENRDLLDERSPARNPAIDWDRLAGAVIERARRVVDPGRASPGGSTLATQIEKYRHSPQGRTESVNDKLRQMASASVRAYLDGQDTLEHRRQLVVDYVNTVPLSAQAGVGEVGGLGDGLWSWYGREFDDVNDALSAGDADTSRSTRDASAAREPSALARRALAFKQVLSLLISQRRPSHYLGEGHAALAALTDSYLRLMASAGVISPELRDAALPLRLSRLARSPPSDAASPADRKATATSRVGLSALLDVPRAYDLDRLDLTAGSTVDGRLQRAITRALRELKNPEAARAAGLYGFRMLANGDDPSRLVFSFTLFERGPQAHLLRVETDSTDQPFDVNEGARLDLGSTAKLRTLVTYLEQVAALHARWSLMTVAQLGALALHGQDTIGLWARGYLASASDRSLATMLDAAMRRRYSASPAESFVTGGGVHRFANFERDDDARVIDVREALERSVNLVFVRLMRDVVRHEMYGESGAGELLAAPGDDPGRRERLAGFADAEGRTFVARFFRQYRGKSPRASEDQLLDKVRALAGPLAAAYLLVAPQASADELGQILQRRGVPTPPTGQALHALRERYAADRLSLADRGYVAGVHPLELWTAAFLRERPGATLRDALAASGPARQQGYVWLLKTRHRGAQDTRIRSALEREAFARIQRAWSRLGYPFDTLTPSLATALGASGDRPAALAELMGILASDGMRLPAPRLASLAFAVGTPYETRLAYRPPAPVRVLAPEIATLVRRSLEGVVDNGTARRLKNAFAPVDGQPVRVLGKTGTGDHRFETWDRHGGRTSSRVVDRTASFVFLVADRYFGTLVVHAHEPYAAGFTFTSALPVQLMKTFVPMLQALVSGAACEADVVGGPQRPPSREAVAGTR